MTSAPSKLGVGIIGVSPNRGWAATAHIPALRALPNYEIRALSARSAESARAAGEAFGVRKVFSDHEQLLAQRDVDRIRQASYFPASMVRRNTFGAGLRLRLASF